MSSGKWRPLQTNTDYTSFRFLLKYPVNALGSIGQTSLQCGRMFSAKPLPEPMMFSEIWIET